MLATYRKRLLMCMDQELLFKAHSHLNTHMYTILLLLYFGILYVFVWNELL